MKRFGADKADPLPSDGRGFIEYANRRQAEAAHTAHRLRRVGRLAILALPVCLSLGAVFGAQDGMPTDRRVTRVTTLDIDNGNRANKPQRQAGSSPLSTTITAEKLPATDTRVGSYSISPTYEADVAWVEDLKQELARQSIQTIEAPDVVRPDQVLVAFDEACAALYTFTTPARQPASMNLTSTMFGPPVYFSDPDTLIKATHEWGVVGHEEGTLILGKNVDKTDLAGATAIISTDAPRLCTDLTASLQDYPERIEHAQAALLDSPRQ